MLKSNHAPTRASPTTSVLVKRSVQPVKYVLRCHTHTRYSFLLWSLRALTACDDLPLGRANIAQHPTAEGTAWRGRG